MRGRALNTFLAILVLSINCDVKRVYDSYTYYSFPLGHLTKLSILRKAKGI